MEIDELHTYIKKPKNGGKEVRVWIEAYRNRNEVVEVMYGDGTTKTGKKFWKKLERYWLFIVCTDGSQAYHKVIHKTKTRIISKSETCLVESKNFLLKNFLARLNKRTSRYSKSIRMLELSIKMFFNKKRLFEIYFI